MTDILLVDKPRGMTSFDVIRVLRKKLGIRKMGHAGTLDPRATGLLILGIGDGTKKLASLIGLPKTYEAGIKLGIATDSGDLDGKIIEERPVPEVSEDDVRAVILSMIGEHDLPVSLFSAIKKNGKPLYAYARAGEVVEQPIRRMIVRSAKFVSYDATNTIVHAVFDVSSGTYIRSLAEEVGKRLGTVAALDSLRRVSVGDFSIENARIPNDIDRL